MGNPVQPPQYGADCLQCTPATWPANKTPASMLAFFTGLQKCPVGPGDNPPDGTYQLDQDPLVPCKFEFDDGTLNITWDTSGANAFLSADDVGGGAWFGKAGPICDPDYTNVYIGCIFPIISIFGTASLSLEAIDTVPWLLTDTYNFLPAEDTEYNTFMLDDAFPSRTVTRLRNLKYGTNVLIKYDPA